MTEYNKRKALPAESSLNFNTMELPRAVPFYVVLAQVGTGRSTLFQMIRDGHFPKPISLTPSGKRKGFLVGEVEQWFAQRAAERV